MNIDFQTFELIEKYHQNELSEEARIAFEKRLQEDAAFAKEVERYKEIQLAAGLLGRLHKKEQIMAIDQQHGAVVKRMGFYQKAAAIAVLVSFGVVYLLLDQYYSTDQLVENHFVRLEKDFTTQSQSDDNVLTSAMEDYNAGDFEKAIEEFSNLPDTINEYWLVQLYIGNAQLELSKVDEALATFDKITKGSELYEENADWYMALAYLKKRDIEKARQVLSQIQEGEFNYSHAQELLKKLNSPVRRLPGID